MLTSPFAEKENEKKALAAIKAQIEADKRERAQKAAQEKALRDGTATGPAHATATVTAPAPATSSLPGREFPETRLQIRLASGGPPLTTTLRSDASCVLLCFSDRFAFSDRSSSFFLALREVAEYIAGQSLSIDVDTVTITQHFPRCVIPPSCKPVGLADINFESLKESIFTCRFLQDSP